MTDLGLLKAYLRAGGQYLGLESRFEVWRAGLMLGGLIEGLEGRFEVWRADLWHEGG